MKTQECFGFKIKDLCSNNIKCSIFECQKQHPKCLAGLCIEYLNDACKLNVCPLLHLKPKERNIEQNIQSILGVQRFNLCKKQNKCKDKECRFIHKFWAEKNCLSCINDDECEPETQASLASKILSNNLLHQDLQAFRESMYKQYSIQNTNPEQLCPNKGICENCTKIHPQFLQDVCVKFIQGKCPLLRNCTHQHIEWEQLSNNVKQDTTNILQACTKKQWLKNQNQNYVRDLQEKFKIYTTKQQHKQLMDMQAKIQKFHQVDLIILMDCTGSMASWIKKAQETVLSLIDKFEGFLKSYFYRIGFVGYRDHCDKEKHIIFHDLSDQIKSVQDFISLQKAEGGGDDAEDIVGALNQAKKLNISKHEDSILITILVADQPCHGKQYHSPLISDHYKDKVPNGTLEDLMKGYYKLKKNNYFTCITINDTTTQMFKIMQNNFPGLVITQISKPEQFENICEYTVNTSIQKTAIFNESQDEEIFVKASWAMPNIQMPLPQQLPCEEENIWNKFLQQVRDSSTTGKTTIRINKKMMNQDMISEGNNSYVFRVFDTFHNKYMIAKIGKDLVDQKVINQSIILKKQKGEEDFDLNEELKKECYRRYNQSAFANQLARSYRKKLIDENIAAMPLFYVLPICYELETPFMNSKYLFAEPFIDIKENWVKFTNNLNFVKKNSEPLTSFSHYSFQATENELIITDLQGKKNILSDPAIQTVGKFDTDMLKDKANLGMQGILAFIKEQHKNCFTLCKQLNLSRSNFPNADIITLDSDEDEGIDIDPINNNEQIYQICQICQSISKTTYLNYVQNYKRNKEQSLCNDCEIRCQSEQRGLCVCCEKEFRFNYFIEMVQFGHFPQICQECRFQCSKANLEKCHYCDRKCQMNTQRKYIGVKSYIFCKFSNEYLNSMSCQKCQSDYSYDLILDKKKYESKTYICLKCQ